MASKLSTFADRLSALDSDKVKTALTGIKHGVERETLRIQTDGSLAQTPHPEALGSALTHDYITTDFSESLLEFITPPVSDPDITLQQLNDVHKYAIEHMQDERLWPMSMPCFINGEDNIPIAQYGTSNIGKMKTLYRIGLKNRYGSMMQAISGVHFNFSFSEEFWAQWLAQTEQSDATKETVSAAYFGLIRNYRRLCWLIPYLYGSSPALCGSFIRGKKTSLPFEQLGKGTYFLPFATSLRMSDLGCTNSEQSDLSICYNDVESYIASLRQAINTPSEKYQKFAGKQNGQFMQLNANVLQIENELYSPIRPKQPIRPLEKPTDALASRGVNYIEVRALDVNPFSPVGISKQQFFFLDVFLTHCLVSPSAAMDEQGYHQTERNLNAVVTAGRDPELRLQHNGQAVSVKQWGEQIFSELIQIAEVMDEANQTDQYSRAVVSEKRKIDDPSLTPSAQILAHLHAQNKDNGVFGVELAEQYRQHFLQSEYMQIKPDEFAKLAAVSVTAQKDREAADKVDFETFLADYFRAY